jgi:hypothetical protein
VDEIGLRLRARSGQVGDDRQVLHTLALLDCASASGMASRRLVRASPFAQTCIPAVQDGVERPPLPGVRVFATVARAVVSSETLVVVGLHTLLARGERAKRDLPRRGLSKVAGPLGDPWSRYVPGLETSSNHQPHS